MSQDTAPSTPTTKSTGPVIPLTIKTGLAPNPKNLKPHYAVEIKNVQGQKISLGDPKATRALVALMNQHAVIGGAACHWGGPSAFAEIMSSVHGLMFDHAGKAKKEWYELFNFINDAGHTENGIYALRANYGMDNLTFNHLRKFRSIESKLTGHGEAHLNPEGVLISNGPLGSGVPQAQGLAVADKLANNSRVTICALSDGGAMEGEAREALAAIPGLAQNGRLNPFLLLVSDNNTKLSGRIDKDSFSMAPTFKALSELGWDLTFVEDGHQLEQVYQSMERALAKLEKNAGQKPVAIVYRTIKGKGVKSTEDSSSGGHGYPLKAYDAKLPDFIKEVYQGQTPPADFLAWADELVKSAPAAKTSSGSSIKREKVQVGLSKAMIKMAKQNYPIISVAADLQGSTGVADFHKAFPAQSLDVGVAEANMISTAVGLSRLGYIPTVDTFAQFGITKGTLPLIMSGLSLGPVIGLFSHTGFQDAADGASHQATTYFSATCSLPHTRVLSVSTSAEAEFYLEKTIEDFKQQRSQGKVPPSTLFFYGRENFAENNGTTQFKWQRGQLLTEGKDILIVATGPTTEMALEAAQLLAKDGIKASVYNHVFINNYENGATEEFLGLLKANNQTVLTVEDHQLVGGMGALFLHEMVTHGWQGRAVSLGINGKYGQSAYLASELYKKHGLDAESIRAKTRELLKK